MEGAKGPPGRGTCPAGEWYPTLLCLHVLVLYWDHWGNPTQFEEGTLYNLVTVLGQRKRGTNMYASCLSAILDPVEACWQQDFYLKWQICLEGSDPRLVLLALSRVYKTRGSTQLSWKLKVCMSKMKLNSIYVRDMPLCTKQRTTQKIQQNQSYLGKDNSHSGTVQSSCQSLKQLLY